LAASALVCPGVSHGAEETVPSEESSGGASDVRIKAMTMKRIDTHSHWQSKQADLKNIALGLGDFTRTPGMSLSRQLALGGEKLYGVDAGLFLRPDSPEELFEKAAALRAKGPTVALETALDAANITLQFCFSGHRPEHCPHTKTSSRVRLLAYIDQAIAGRDKAFCPDGAEMDFDYYDSICGHFGELGALADYLDALDSMIDSWRSHGVVGLKTAFAYTIGLEFSDPSREEAESAFARKRDMTLEEITTVQHYAFRRVLLACQRNELPVVVHTGFQIWGHSDLRQSNPILLHNLLIDKRYKDVTWVLLHGGNPYVGETTYLARMFPNVNIDFTWISWMTRARFRMALAEWIEIVPHGKFCFGSDSNSPENIVGSGEVTREVITNVLEDQIDRRIIDEQVALDFIEHTYLRTPTRLFQL
jgi:amidohydrolase family protein